MITIMMTMMMMMMMIYAVLRQTQNGLAVRLRVLGTEIVTIAASQTCGACGGGSGGGCVAGGT